MGLNVLVVDDSSVMRTMIIKTLRMSGLPVSEILQASDGAEALSVLSKHKVDLALVDINMPILNGEQLIQKLREDARTAKLPVVVVSTEGSHTRIARLKDHGAGFVHKPFTPEMLKETLWEMVGGTT